MDGRFAIRSDRNPKSLPVRGRSCGRPGRRRDAESDGGRRCRAGTEFRLAGAWRFGRFAAMDTIDPVAEYAGEPERNADEREDAVVVRFRQSVRIVAVLFALAGFGDA